MPTKKRKYEARFPPARIKKIMQTDEEIGKVAAAVPVIISRALEIFLQQLVEKSAEQTHAKRAKTMTTGHLKQCIESENQFDFLKDLVANIADMPNQEDDDNGESGETKPKKARRPRSTTGEKKKTSKKRSKSSSSNDTDEEDNPSDNNEETTTIFPRASSDLPGSSHQSEATCTREPATTQVASSSTSNSYDLPNQSNPFNSSNLQRMPMMLKPQHDDDDDDEDYDQDD